METVGWHTPLKMYGLLLAFCLHPPLQTLAYHFAFLDGAESE